MSTTVLVTHPHSGYVSQKDPLARRKRAPALRPRLAQASLGPLCTGPRDSAGAAADPSVYTAHTKRFGRAPLAPMVLTVVWINQPWKEVRS